MKKAVWSVITFFLLAVLASGCTPASTPIPPTTTSSPIPPTSTPTPLPTDTPVPTFTSTPEPSVEVFGPITILEAWELIPKDYRVMGFDEINSGEQYCEELFAKANIPEFDITACESVGVSRGLNDTLIEGWVLTINDYKGLPALIDCYSDPPIGNIQEDAWIYETSSGSIRIVFSFYDVCTGAGATMP